MDGTHTSHLSSGGSMWSVVPPHGGASLDAWSEMSFVSRVWKRSWPFNPGFCGNKLRKLSPAGGCNQQLSKVGIKLSSTS